ncbi:hypothetical protein [Halobacteriovorax sp. JY17]|uniref:hypothetical protein n=1 Tax=Halobacteriovorax sp. JY17 TaxID=2014617 RepID=UPI000C527486|nr:hypothetical protein [Halobacteriovorax sp. JY17]PIK15715.1 MAG: hypothetical protein CES88_03020 [Halobacteriovorax sp. JY17]
MSTLKKIIPLLILLSSNVYCDEMKNINEVLLERKFPVRVMDKNFNVTKEDILVEAKVIGTHSFIGSNPAREFADNRVCDLNVKGMLNTKFQQSESYGKIDTISLYGDYSIDRENTLNQYKAFNDQNSYRGLDCEKSILRLNSYLFKWQYRRAMKLDKDFVLFTVKDIITPEENLFFVYPKFNLSEELLTFINEKIISNVYKRVLDRSADEYELEAALENKEGEDWGYDLQENLVEKFEKEESQNLDEEITLLLEQNDSIDYLVENFWIDHCLSSDIDYELYLAKDCLINLSSNSKIENFVQLDKQCKSRRKLENLLRDYFPSNGEKCQEMARAGYYGNEAKLKISAIKNQASDLSNHLDRTYLKYRNIYERVLDLVKTDGDLYGQILQNKNQFERTLKSIDWDHQLFYEGYKDFGKEEELIRKLENNLHRIPTIIRPGWIDPVRPYDLSGIDFPRR